MPRWSIRAQGYARRTKKGPKQSGKKQAKILLKVVEQHPTSKVGKKNGCNKMNEKWQWTDDDAHRRTHKRT